jgi:hypothetical protein
VGFPIVRSLNDGPIAAAAAACMHGLEGLSFCVRVCEAFVKNSTPSNNSTHGGILGSLLTCGAPHADVDLSSAHRIAALL